MTRSDDQRIADILDARDELSLVVELSTQSSLSEQVPVRAAERLLEIIGEAAANVSEGPTFAVPKTMQSPWLSTSMETESANDVSDFTCLGLR